jgi:hypothetical protein
MKKTLTLLLILLIPLFCEKLVKHNISDQTAMNGKNCISFPQNSDSFTPF